MQNFSDHEFDMKTGDVSSGTEKKSSNIFVSILLILAVGIIALYAYTKSQDSDFSKLSLKSLFITGTSTKEKEDVFAAVSEIPYESKENTAFAVYKDYIVKAGSEGIKLIDKKGMEIWNDSIPVSKPAIKTNGSDLLVADIGGMDFVVVNGKAEKWKGRADGKIINADISQDGHVSILSYAKRYGGEATVFDSLGIEIYKAFIADNSPIAAGVSPSSREMLVNCINTAGVKAQTYIKLYDTGGNEIKEIARKILQPVNCIYPVMWYTGDDSIYLVGDIAVTLLDKAGEQKWTQEYDSVYSACMAGSRNLAVAVKGKSGSELKILGTNGRELASSLIDSEVLNVSSFGNIIAVNTVREVHFINDRGDTIGKYTSKADIMDVYFFNRHEAMVVSKSSVTVINITRR